MNRRTILCLAAIAGGAAIVDLAATLGGTPDSAYLRTGTVVALLGSSQVVVDIGGGQQVDMPALTQYEPILGDVVQILQQGPVQLVLGRTKPMSGDNILANPSFELDLPAAAPSYWTKVLGVGSAGDASFTTEQASGWGSVAGTRWLEHNSQNINIATVHAVSDAIPVDPGERWTAAGYAVNISADTDGGNSAIALAWFSDSSTMYPTTVAADSAIANIGFPVRGMPSWTLLRSLSGNGIAVPDAASYMRVVLTSIIRGGVGSSAYWDAIVCRRMDA